MTPARLRLLSIAAALIILVGGYLALSKRVTVLADGRAYQFATRAITVGAALSEPGVQLGPEDRVEPSQFSLVRDGLIIAVHRAALIQLRVDGRFLTFVSAERDPNAILSHFGVSLGQDDRLLLAGNSVEMDEDLAALPVLHLEVRRAVPVTVRVDGEVKQFLSSAPLLGQALSEQGIQIEVADLVEPGADTPLTAAIDANITRARPLQITIGDRSISVLSAAETVGGALADAGLALQGLDRSQPDEDQPIPEDGQITVRRITESLELEQALLPHATQLQEDPNADLDTSSVVQQGQDGVKATRTRVRYEDGAEVSRKTEAERVLVEAKTQINGYGTKIVIYTEVVNGVTVEYYRKIQVFTTWYSACNSGVSGCLYGTSAGIPLEHGVIATWINWYRELKLASVYIPGYGNGVIADVGAWPDRSIPWMDLAFSEPVSGIPWTNAWVTVYFTTPVPAYVPPVWPP